MDLMTVASAVHWFDLPAFIREVDRVLKPGGCVAVIGTYRIRTVHHENELIKSKLTKCRDEYVSMNFIFYLFFFSSKFLFFLIHRNQSVIIHTL